MRVLVVILFIAFSEVFITSCSTAKRDYVYKAADQKLYDTIVRLDAVFFNAYNTCNLDRQAEMYSDSVEFYHDYGGLMTSKNEIIDGTRKNVCGKVTRELVKGSIEVYPINNYGAIEMGLHKFHNNREPEGTPSPAGKFIIIWQHKNNEWKLARVVSLH